MSPRSRGLIAEVLVFVAAFPWVNSEWQGGWLQAVGGASLIAIPIGLATWGLLDGSRRGARVLKGLLALAVLLSLGGIYSYGVYTTPFLLAPLWLATNRARGPEAIFWVVLAAPCALLTGWLLSSSLEQPDDHIPAMFTALVVVLFSLTALGRPNRGLDRADGT